MPCANGSAQASCLLHGWVDASVSPTCRRFVFCPEVASNRSHHVLSFLTHGFFMVNAIYVTPPPKMQDGTFQESIHFQSPSHSCLG